MGNPRAKKGVQTGSEGVRGRNKSEQQVDSRSKLGKEGVVSPPPPGADQELGTRDPSWPSRKESETEY